MNWFRKYSQQGNTITINTHPSYYQIGHQNYYDKGIKRDRPIVNPTEKIWLWCNGNLDVIPAGFTNSHGSIPGYDDNHESISRKCYKGRFGIYGDRKLVSVIAPMNVANFRELPDKLYKDLYTEFGNDIEVHTF